jgi:GT2 family glycosyltransferase
VSAPELAIIVTSYQMPWHVRRVLESIAVQRTSRPIEVVVSDDGSTDETGQMVRAFAARAAFPVRLVTHPHVGFHAARCRNEGARQSTAANLLFVDGDCLLPPDHIEQHLRSLRPGIVTCSYCVRLDEAVSQHATLEAVRGGQFMQWTTREQLRKLRRMHLKSLWYGLIGHPTKPAFRSGNFAVSRSEYERVNGFDENFLGWGCEDDDFGRRLRSAGIRAVSILHRTCAYHLWHPPAPTRPTTWKQGSNVPYLQRPIRLTRCAHGLVSRAPRDLTVRLADEIAGGPLVQALVERYAWTIETSRRARADLEVLFCPGRGLFSRRTDCRVLVCLEDSLHGAADARQADVVLSPGGHLGEPGQVRLRLDDVDALWAVISGQNLSLNKAAA